MEYALETLINDFGRKDLKEKAKTAKKHQH
jgi:hypothetical protein